MTTRLRRYRCAFIFVTSIWSSTLWLSAQVTFDGPTTPGQPWTYVPDSLVPERAIDTAFANELIRYFTIPGFQEIRRLYRVYLHPELLPSPTVTDSIRATIMYDPDSIRSVAWGRFRSDTTLRPGDSVINFYGFRSLDRDRNGASIRINWFRNNMNTDSMNTVYFVSMSASPSSYYIFRGQLVDGNYRWGYFMQFVDPIYHPAITSLSEAPISRLVTAPWPNPCSNRLELTPAPGTGHIDVSVFDALGREVYRRPSSALAGSNAAVTLTLDDAAFAALVPGVYHVVVHRQGLGAQVAPFVKAE